MAPENPGNPCSKCHIQAQKNYAVLLNEFYFSYQHFELPQKNHFVHWNSQCLLLGFTKALGIKIGSPEEKSK